MGRKKTIDWEQRRFDIIQSIMTTHFANGTITADNDAFASDLSQANNFAERLITALNPHSPQSASPKAKRSHDDGDSMLIREFVDLWNECCPDNPPIEDITDALRNKIGHVLLRYSAEDMQKAIRLIGATPFLRGDNPNWRASMGWLLKSNGANIAKILDGYYSHTPEDRFKFDEIMKGNTDDEGPDPYSPKYR